MAQVIKTTSLYFQENGSDKVYIANLIEVDKASNKYKVVCQFGRRGSTLSETEKTKGEVSYGAADSAYNKVISEKTKKGYQLTSGGTPGTASVSDSALGKIRSGLMPQLLNPIYLDEAMKYINDDTWMMQEKFDGQRLMTQKANDKVTGSNKLGYVTSLASTIHNSITSLSVGSITTDGESIGDHYFIFDVMEINGQDLRGLSAIERITRYESALATSNEYLHMVETAYTQEEKLALYLRVMDSGGEGVVFKRKNSKYTAGRPNSGGDQIKLKFIESASCVVIAQHSSKRSVSFGLLVNGQLVDHGNVAIPNNQDIPNTDDIVEIQYLYAMKNGSLIQPVYLGKRTDIERIECDVSQLKYKREALAA